MGIQALAAAAATHTAGTPRRVGAGSTTTIASATAAAVSSIVTAGSAPQVTAQAVQAAASSPASGAGAGSASLSTATPAAAAPGAASASTSVPAGVVSAAGTTGSPMRIVQAQGSPTYRVASPSGALGRTLRSKFRATRPHVSPNSLLLTYFLVQTGQTVRLASPGTTLLRSAAPGQPGKQIFLQRPGSNQPGQIVTLVKTSQGMTVASVSSLLFTFIECYGNMHFTLISAWNYFSFPSDAENEHYSW